jgi:hypothetical protein
VVEVVSIQENPLLIIWWMAKLSKRKLKMPKKTQMQNLKMKDTKI